MFAKVKQIFHHENKDLQKRILFTLGVLFIFKLGTSIIVPGIDKNALGTNRLGFLELMNLMGGGSMERFSIFSLGVLPYINASIIIQLLQMDIIPYFSELSKEGPVGRRKLNQITRYMGIIFAFIEGYAFSFAFLGSSSAFEYLYVATILTAGTAFCLWLGDQITQKGIGNGISLLIFAGIVAGLPHALAATFEQTRQGELSTIGLLIIICVVVAVTYFVVFVERGQRRIAINYAKRQNGNRFYAPPATHLPLKLICRCRYLASF